VNVRNQFELDPCREFISTGLLCATFKQRDLALHAIAVNKAEHDLYRTVFGLCDFLIGN
jgi:hypothetical protein